MTRLAFPVLFAGCTAAAVMAQNVPKTAFEVVSVRQSPPSDFMAINTGALRGDRWTAEFATPLALIRRAYEPRFQFPGQIVGGPGWLESERFHIDARTGRGATAEQLRLMMQTLLARPVPAGHARRDAAGPGLRSCSLGTRRKPWRGDAANHHRL